MVNLKVVINDKKSGRSCQIEANEDASKQLRTMRVGDTFKGELLDFTGYEFKITGGSDIAGFPLRADLPGNGRRRILTKSGVIGVSKINRGGVKVRRTVCAGGLDDKTVQVNALITKEGKAQIEALKPKAEGEAAAPAKEKK